MSVFDTFTKKHDFLICVDSDGCAMDTMDCKHFCCFGPCLVEEWGLDEWREAVLFLWNEINLYRTTRGINRFKALSLCLQEINEQYTPIAGIDALIHWADTAPTLSNDGISKAVEEAADPVAKAIFKKALSWSKAVNAGIVNLPKDLKVPYHGAKEGLAAAHAFADVAVVSSANHDAVEEEWSTHGLLEHVDIILAQDVGSKAHCIAEMLKFGYAPDKVLMIGDAPGDSDAADKNGVYYYPILVNKEPESWQELISSGLGHVTAGTYGGEYQNKKKEEFLRNLGG